MRERVAVLVTQHGLLGEHRVDDLVRRGLAVDVAEVGFVASLRRMPSRFSSGDVAVLALLIVDAPSGVGENVPRSTSWPESRTLCPCMSSDAEGERLGGRPVEVLLRPRSIILARVCP